jgi:hypothetical protein
MAELVLVKEGALVPTYIDDGNYYRVVERTKMSGVEKIWELVPEDQLISLEEAQEKYPEEFI